jgi:hypothetical protein
MSCCSKLPIMTEECAEQLRQIAAAAPPMSTERRARLALLLGTPDQRDSVVSVPPVTRLNGDDQ